MPIYEYQCGKCGVFEHSQRISDAALTKCPTCRRKVQRLISNTSFQLKGSGWYVTDYGRGGKKGDGKGDDKGDGGSKSESSSEGSSESTSETKAKPKAEPKTKSKSETKAASAA
jgi:putative FmdB family regulatory protein